MDTLRKRHLDEREQEEKSLEECVLKILRHGDPHQLTESKVRKLAASETGFDLTDPANRKIVKLTVENYFLSYQQDGSQHEKAAQAKSVAHKTAALPSPKPERRRKLVTFDDDDDDEEEENAEPAARGSGANGTKQSAGDAVPESEEEGEKRSSRVTAKKRADDKEDDEETERVNSKKDAVHSPPKRRHSDEEESDADEKEEKSINAKNAASVRNKQGRKARDEDEEEGERRGPRALPERKKSSNDDDTTCQLSKNRFVSVQDFKGKALVSIREYYEKDGKQLPTRKGISLTVDQWEALKEGIPDIEAAIQQLK